MGRIYRDAYVLGNEYSAAKRAYSWPIGRMEFMRPFKEEKFDPYTYFSQHFPRYSCHQGGEISKHVNLLVDRIMAVVNEKKEFDDAVVLKIIQRFKQKLEADAVSKNNLVKTALFHIAFGVGVPQMVNLFYKMKFQGFYDHRGHFGIHRAAKQGHVECCRLLLQLDNRNANLISRAGKTALSRACGEDAPYEMVKLLLENGADPNLQGDSMCYEHSARDLPLLLAASHGDEDLVTLLLDCGADFNLTTSFGETVLHIAARCRKMAMFTRFLELGVSLYAVDNAGRSCLMNAVEWNFLPLVHQILESAGRSGRALELVNGVTDDGESVLMLAAGSSDPEILRELSAFGVDYNYVSPEGKSALSIALDLVESDNYSSIYCTLSIRDIHIPSGRERLIWIRSLLLGTSPEIVAQNIELLMFSVARNNACDLFHYILDSEISLESRLSFDFKYSRAFGNTMLSEAVRHESIEVVELLLSAGAKMIYPHSPEKSPFSSAFDKYLFNINVIECFLKHDVNLNFIRDESSHNVPEALTSLLQRYEHPLFLDVLQLLLRCGLDPSVTYWCSCGSGISTARLRKRRRKHVLLDGLKNTQIANYSEMIKMLLAFSPSITPCLNEILDTIGYVAEVPSLQHLCRLSYRKLFSPSQLLHEQWTEASNLPDKIKLYLSFGGPL